MATSVCTHVLAFLGGTVVNLGIAFNAVTNSYIDPQDISVPPKAVTIIYPSKTMNQPVDTIVPSIDDGFTYGENVVRTLSPVLIFLLILFTSFLLSINYVQYLAVKAKASTPEQEAAFHTVTAKLISSRKGHRKDRRKMAAERSNAVYLRGQLETWRSRAADRSNQLKECERQNAELREQLETSVLNLQSAQLQHYLGLIAMRDQLAPPDPVHSAPLSDLVPHETRSGTVLREGGAVAEKCTERVAPGSTAGSMPPSPFPTIETASVAPPTNSVTDDDVVAGCNGNVIVNDMEMDQSHYQPPLTLNMTDGECGSGFEESVDLLLSQFGDGDEPSDHKDGNKSKTSGNSQAGQQTPRKKKNTHRGPGRKKTARMQRWEEENAGIEAKEKQAAEDARVETEENEILEEKLAKKKTPITKAEEKKRQWENVKEARAIHGSAIPAKTPSGSMAQRLNAPSNATTRTTAQRSVAPSNATIRPKAQRLNAPPNIATGPPAIIPNSYAPPYALHHIPTNASVYTPPYTPPYAPAYGVTYYPSEPSAMPSNSFAYGPEHNYGYGPSYGPTYDPAYGPTYGTYGPTGGQR